ncbi:hypothetical protein M2162_001476 [Streptomyces sp. SAI-041]|nr:hypothetical protein [Streptomyces sp. SAI-041]
MAMKVWVMRWSATARRARAGSNSSCRTTVPPTARTASAIGPAVWLSGVTTSSRGSSVPREAAVAATTLSQARTDSRIPLGWAVLPLVKTTAARSLGSAAVSGPRRAGSAGSAGTAPPAPTPNPVTAGRRLTRAHNSWARPAFSASVNSTSTEVSTRIRSWASSGRTGAVEPGLADRK